MPILYFDGGFLGEIEVHCNHLPAEPQNDAKEEFQIGTVFINGHALSRLSQEQWLGVFTHQKPKGMKADKYSIQELIELSR